ncbi:MAG: DNA modification methylase [Planctomycetes bacterium]|nr:DNA modification methylase [Planctomycetota bacterium]
MDTLPNKVDPVNGRLGNEIHPIANLFPLLAGAEFEALVEDIRRHGLREPITVHPDGRVLDGRNRLRACEILGIDPAYRTWDGKGSETAFVISLNLHRRHLTPSQRAMVASDALPMLEMEAKERQRQHGGTAPGKGKNTGGKNTTSEGKSRDQAAEMFHIAARYISDAKKLKAEAPELAEKVRAGEMDIPEAKKELTAKRREAIQESYRQRGAGAVLPAEIDLRHGDFREVLKNIADNSVDAIITDPPWHAAEIENFLHLGKFAARVLKPGAPLIAYVGHLTYLDAANRLAEKLKFVSSLTLFLSGSHLFLQCHNIHVLDRPILFFAKGKYKRRGPIETVIRNDTPDKSFHPWQQGLRAFEYLVERLTTNPGDLVVDPFAGSGTTMVAAQRQGRRAIGAEIDEENFKIAKARIAEEARIIEEARLGELARRLEGDTTAPAGEKKKEKPPGLELWIDKWSGKLSGQAQLFSNLLDDEENFKYLADFPTFTREFSDAIGELIKILASVKARLPRHEGLDLWGKEAPPLDVADLDRIARAAEGVRP